MTSILIVAHGPLASSLQQVATHAYTDCSRQLAAVDIDPGVSLEGAEARIRAALESAGDVDVLILTDAFGATPSNAALNVADGVHARVVSGVNVPMLWRTLCYGHLPLGDLVARAADGGRQGIMQLGCAAPQNPPIGSDRSDKPPNDDPDANSDQ